MKKIGMAVFLAGVGFMSLSGCMGVFEDPSLYESPSCDKPLERIDELELDAIAKEKQETDETPAEEPQEKELSLTIQRCRALALENNLEIQVQLYEPALARQQIAQARADFEPLLFSNLDFIKTDTPTSLSLEASQADLFSQDLGLRIPLTTGGQITLDFPFNWTKTNNTFSTLNPSYSADFSGSIYQPLLRGGGVQTNTYEIRIASLNKDISRAQTRLQVIRVLAAVDRVYWRLYAARRELEVRKEEYDLTLTQVEIARRKVNAGEIPEIEILRAESAAAENLESIIQAQNDLQDRQRELKQALNKIGLTMKGDTVIVPNTQPSARCYQIDHEKLIHYAMENRMELLQVELQLAQDESTIQLRRNGLLPVLNAGYTYNVNGLGPASSDAYDLMLQNRFVDHRVGLVLEIPLGNRYAKSRYETAITERLQRLQSQKWQQQQIHKEVLDAADQLESNWHRVLAARKNAELAHRTLQAEQHRFELGLQTSIEVLLAQSRYTDALSRKNRALVEYQIAQVDLAYASGCLLGTAGISWELPEQPQPLSQDMR